MITAVYALSGDPITFGHIDIINRAAAGFDHLIVGLGVNPNKKYMLTPHERIAVAKQSLSHLNNVEVMFFEGLLVDFAFEQGATIIVRGIRNASDAVAEQALDQINGSQMNIDTFFMFSRSKLAHVSSSNVKALQAENGLIHEYVPLPVKKMLERKISHQLVYGVTGVMGSGKSYVAEQLAIYAEAQHAVSESNPLVHNIELDKLAHQVYESDKPGYKDIREKIQNHFGTLDRSKIGQIAFGSENSKEHVDFLNNIFKDPVMVLLRQELRGKKGIVLINAALLVESDLLNLCNNHVILVNAEDAVRHERLVKFRNIDPVVAEKRIKHMKSNSAKRAQIKRSISSAHFGNIVDFDNSSSNLDLIANLYEQLKGDYYGK
ncbi:pantetheine-phosphate adenylyltransferase [Pseudomonas serbica]|uniref:pantetheine-phosphate adenylyltransferase n=1 Tax=Pseudomonas serbica TaxID=2965074 RepID=UPI00237B5E8E|nr:pantetheine-phosphate adenylyltransferase [Pseudomonas serbica]